MWSQDGTLFVPATGGATPGGPAITYWKLILEIPPNVTALAATATTGLYVVTGAGTSATRSIAGVAGQITVADGDGVEANPTVGLADVSATAGGTLQRYGFDSKGRRTQQHAATASDLAFVPAGGITATDVQSAIVEAASGGGGGGVLPVCTGELIDDQPVFVYGPDGRLIYAPVT